MLKFLCDTDKKEEIKDFLFTELSKMYLHSVGSLHGSDMQDECMGACFGGGFGGVLFEGFDLGSASDDEIIRRAYNQGIDLNDYRE